MIGPFKLVLDEHPCVRATVLAQNVGSKRSDSFLLRFQFQLHPKGFGENFQILLTCQPGSKVAGLGGPDAAQIDSFKSAKGSVRHSGIIAVCPNRFFASASSTKLSPDGTVY